MDITEESKTNKSEIFYSRLAPGLYAIASDVIGQIQRSRLSRNFFAYWTAAIITFISILYPTCISAWDLGISYRKARRWSDVFRVENILLSILLIAEIFFLVSFTGCFLHGNKPGMAGHYTMVILSYLFQVSRKLIYYSECRDGLYRFIFSMITILLMGTGVIADRMGKKDFSNNAHSGGWILLVIIPLIFGETKDEIKEEGVVGLLPSIMALLLIFIAIFWIGEFKLLYSAGQLRQL